ncbi:hypothetical protein THAOC_19798 [Thalassiosira oceanica]|uniref:Uncharacterized protein n=1 Tax=Thalassiosira oceanica TaxID=159749 RepID=K0SN80_THAOC|nr:hypothetical protein THAOC_19798 [Thalassiosira oceanica]|eukprot:EJK59927.1 hypothetical protein THAOC_19798 [Thalassiosira oceanica]
MEAVAVEPDCGGLGHDMDGILGPLPMVLTAADVDIGPRNTEGVTAAPARTSPQPCYATMLAIQTKWWDGGIGHSAVPCDSRSGRNGGFQRFGPCHTQHHQPHPEERISNRQSRLRLDIGGPLNPLNLRKYISIYPLPAASEEDYRAWGEEYRFKRGDKQGTAREYILEEGRAEDDREGA